MKLFPSIVRTCSGYGRTRDDKNQASRRDLEDQEKGRAAAARAEARGAGLAGRQLFRHLVAERHVRSPIVTQQVLAQEIARAPDDPDPALMPRCRIRNRRARQTSETARQIPEKVSGQALTLPPRKVLMLHCTIRRGPMAVRIRMPGGTLKVKVYRELRDRERTRRIPVVKIGRVYFTWWSNRQRLIDDQSPR